ncbi:MAG TPA: hypothetical protein VFA59_10220 [Vicinamibacterales bacterium]|nr:hypothetical protein [Vicinamibacterales bacterium]
MRPLAAACVLLALAPGSATMQEPGGVTGYVLAPDATPVASGTVIAQSGFARSFAPIDETGRFRLLPRTGGVHELLINVPGFAPYRMSVTVPDSKTLTLPVIRLDAGAYFRVRLVTPEGEPIIAPQLRHRLFDSSNRPMFDALDRAAPVVGSDGAVTIGPLPHGIVTTAVDMPFFAQTRLPDVTIAESGKTLDAGTIAIQHPGAVLHVDVVNGNGAPVANQDVFLADSRPRSPLVFPTIRTDAQGRVTFERLAAGRYRVSTSAAARCNGDPAVLVSRVVPVTTNGTTVLPIVAGGHATFRITTPLGPASGAFVVAHPTILTPGPQPRGCHGFTDADGRVTLATFPPGPAEVQVRVANSTYVRQVEVPLDGREVAFAIPDGLAAVHVVNEKNVAQANATVTWIGSGGRVEASTTATGDVLLDGVGTTAGTLAVEARNYQKAEESLTEPPAVLHTVALTPLPRPTPLRVRVITAAREPVRNALVQLIPGDPTAMSRLTLTNANGIVTFGEAPPGSVQLIASADGFVLEKRRTTSEAGEVVFTLTRGYRVIATVDLPPEAGPQIVQVLTDAGASMDEVLDADSDRRIEPPRRISLGPLVPGTYVIELRGADGRRQQRVRVVDADVATRFR